MFLGYQFQCMPQGKEVRVSTLVICVKTSYLYNEQAQSSGNLSESDHIGLSRIGMGVGSIELIHDYLTYRIVSTGFPGYDLITVKITFLHSDRLSYSTIISGEVFI